LPVTLQSDSLLSFMDSKTSDLTFKRILLFWLPLESTWLMMALESTLLSAFIARLDEPKFNLAAYGVAFSFILVIEAPILMIISAATALVKDRDSFLKLQRFTFVLIGLITLIMGLTLIPPFFYFLTQRLIGLPARVAELTYKACLILTPVPWAIGLRRFSQGLLIRHNQTRFVAFGTAIRLGSLVLIGLCFYIFSSLEGAEVGALVLTIAVVLEAVSSRYMARPIIRELLNENRAGTSAAEPLTYRAITTFYLPLALTSLLALGVQPSITFFVGKSRMALESLAVLPVINGLVFLFMSVGLSYHEASIALLGEGNRNFKKLRDFAFILGGVSMVLLAAIGFTPLSYFWFRLVSGLSEHLTEFALAPVKILAVMPGVWVMLTFQRSVLVNSRHTGPITWATGLELILVILTLFIAIRTFDFIGAAGAALALLVGRSGGTLCLFPSFLKILRGSKPAPSPCCSPETS
jgi:progressive ankylosis protein